MINTLDRLLDIEKRAEDSLSKANSEEALFSFEAEFLGKKGVLTEMVKELKNLSDDEKKKIGPQIQETKMKIEKKWEEKKIFLKKKEIEERLEKEWIDTTKELPREKGSIHPINRIQKKVEDIFLSMGFEIADGPEIETEWHNFDALNIPESHPARDMQDTFWIKNDDTDSKKNFVLRTHTSCVQIRKMLEKGAPLRIIAPGRVYRNEATDMTHDATFYQVEGLVVDKNISLAHLKGTIQALLTSLFEKEIKIRFRPGYFPFVEPGLEVDMWFEYKTKEGETKGMWMEFMGAGMVHPNVLKNGNIDPNIYSGFAFGFGLTRLAMKQYEIDDIRLLFSQKKAFLSQF